jgi:hypothetical protein
MLIRSGPRLADARMSKFRRVVGVNSQTFCWTGCQVRFAFDSRRSSAAQRTTRCAMNGALSPVYPKTADIGQRGRQVSSVPILLQKSPQLVCRIKTRNNCIAANAFLNQSCAFAPNLGKIFRARMSKIVLQQYRHECEVPECPLSRRS